MSLRSGVGIPKKCFWSANSAGWTMPCPTWTSCHPASTRFMPTSWVGRQRNEDAADPGRFRPIDKLFQEAGLMGHLPSRVALAILTGLWLAGCDDHKTAEAPPPPKEVTAASIGHYCGMALAE